MHIPYLFLVGNNTLDSTGNLFLADLGNERVRKVMLFASYPTLTLNNVGPYNEGNYSVIITNDAGSVTSSMTPRPRSGRGVFVFWKAGASRSRPMAASSRMSC